MEIPSHNFCRGIIDAEDELAYIEVSGLKNTRIKYIYWYFSAYGWNE